MAVPKKKTSYTKKQMRRSHDGLKTKSLVTCPACNEPKLPHRVCPSCQTYKGKQILGLED